MSQRFFVPPIQGPTASLDGAEAHHLLRVMRAGVGDAVTLFDGSGAEWRATITAAGRSRVDFELGERREVDRELPFTLVLGVAMPKGERQKQLVEKLTELGVGRLVPLVTERSVAQPKKASALDRLRRTVVEASKQCGRNRLMGIDEPTSLADFLAEHREAAVCWFAHPPGEAPPTRGDAGGASCAIAVGPEGGFTEAEEAAARSHGWRVISLGKRVLRVETAAASLSAIAAAAAG